MQLDGLKTEVKENDNLLIFYAGHGSKWDEPDMKDGYWCPADAEWETYPTLINNSTIKDLLKLINSQNTLMILIRHLNY